MRSLFGILLIGLLACQTPPPAGQEAVSDYLSIIERERQETDSLFRQADASPLPGMEAIASFEGLLYFPIDTQYRITAQWVRMREQEPFTMPTSGNHDNSYVTFGQATFTCNGIQDTLYIYQNLDLVKEGRIEESLFIPFRDATSGQSTYGGGRYLNLAIPENDEIVIDFNKAYNPYCVYNYKYSCPIPPPENTLSMAIEAGEKMIDIPQP